VRPLAILLATGFGLGRLPVAPATWASAAVAILLIPAAVRSPLFLGIALLAVVPLAIWSSGEAEKELGRMAAMPSMAPDIAIIRTYMEWLLDLPWVGDAEVRRNLPNTISIRLIEKRPFALWRNGKSMVVIERSGAVITDVDTGGFETLSLFAGAGAPEAAASFLDAVRPYRAVTARLQTIQRMGERRWDLLLAGGVTIRLPEEGWESQLAELEMLIVEKAILERDIEMIDLRYPDNYVFRLHNGDSRPVSRERRA